MISSCPRAWSRPNSPRSGARSSRIAAKGALDPTDAGKSEDELKREYRTIAERRVRLGLLLAEIGRRHNLEVSDQEVAQAISFQARNFPGQEKQIFEMYQRNPSMVANVRAPLYEEKVVDYVMELVSVTNQNVSREALFADEEAACGSGARTKEAQRNPKPKQRTDSSPGLAGAR